MSNVLYYTAPSCGMANFISAHKAGLVKSGKLAAYQVDIMKKVILQGPKKDQDFLGINPKGNVPAIVFQSGAMINENVATQIWIADQNPAAKLLAPLGSEERYVAISKLAWVASELHPSYRPLFNPNFKGSKPDQVTILEAKLKFLNDVELADGKAYIAGAEFTCADSYLYIVLSWSQYIGVDISKFNHVEAYYSRVKELDFVKEAHAEVSKSE